MCLLHGFLLWVVEALWLLAQHSGPGKFRRITSITWQLRLKCLKWNSRLASLRGIIESLCMICSCSHLTVSLMFAGQWQHSSRSVGWTGLTGTCVGSCGSFCTLFQARTAAATRPLGIATIGASGGVLEVNVTKERKDLYTICCKPSLKTNKCKDTPSPWIGRILFKMSVLSKVIYRCSIISIKIPMAFSTEIEKSPCPNSHGSTKGIK